MVWGLFPVDPLPGEDKYYIFSTGTYKVGRKGCDIIINKDKGVSRIHAEIIVDEMTSLDHLQKKSSTLTSKTRIRDCSKYGTYIHKNAGSKEKVHEFPNKETLLKDGELVSFGTGSATYRFCFVSLKFLVHSMKPLDKSLQDKISSLGASISRNWSSDCTHVLVEDFFPLKEDLVDAIVGSKHIASLNWVELIAGRRICTEIPSCISYAPTLTFEGAKIKLADPQTREYCLKGYTFLLEATHKYKFKDRFQVLLEVSGAKVVSLESFCPNSQGVGDEGNNRVVRVVPTEFTSSQISRNVSSLPSVTDVELITAVFCGHLDPSIISSPPVLVTSSCSTDETIVADSDTEIETATSVPTRAMVDQVGSAEDDCKMIVDNHSIESPVKDSRGETGVHTILSTIFSTESDNKPEVFFPKVKSSESEANVEVQPHAGVVNWSESGNGRVQRERDRGEVEKTSKVERERDRGEVEKRIKVEETGYGNLDVIYSQDLIVRDINFPASVGTSMDGQVVNFKRFRKRGAPSGNSYDNLIPFSKYPYKEFDYGDEKVAKSIKEEKMRKQMESISEDLFNNEKGKRRGTAGSLLELLSRR